jgi:hypothetical protein
MDGLGRFLFAFTRYLHITKAGQDTQHETRAGKWVTSKDGAMRLTEFAEDVSTAMSVLTYQWTGTQAELNKVHLCLMLRKPYRVCPGCGGNILFEIDGPLVEVKCLMCCKVRARWRPGLKGWEIVEPRAT